MTDDDCADVVASLVVDIVLELEDIEDVDIVETEDVVDAKTENCACTCAVAYFGASFAVTYTVY